MSEGELLQIEKARRLDITEEVYFDIIRRKTASLLAACCACGAVSAGADQDTGLHVGSGSVGLAFQIQDTCSTSEKATGRANPRAKTSANAR